MKINKELEFREPEQFRENDDIKQLWSLFWKDKIAVFSGYLFLVLLLLVLFGNLIAPYSVSEQFIGNELMPPSWDDKGQILYFFGTDDLGRDIFSRVLSGFYYTVGSALVITFFVAVIGGAIGIAAGLKQGRSFWLISHLFDTFLVIPILLIAIIIAALMETSLMNAMLAVFLAMLPNFIHKIYQATEQELKREYVVTLILDGATKWDLAQEVILPNVTIVAVRSLSQVFILAILDISALSFISLGAQSPTPEWGNMIRESVELIYIAPWTVMIPGLAIILSIFAITMLGSRVARTLDKYRYY